MSTERDKVDAVAQRTLSTDELVAMLRTLGFDRATREAAVDEITKTTKPSHFGDNNYGYIVRANGFETFVSWREASSSKEAYDLCMKDRHQCWTRSADAGRYESDYVFDEFDSNTRVRRISHNEYCDWVRSKDK